MDIYQRACRKKGIILDEPKEEEINSGESVEEIMREALDEYENEEETEEIDCEAVQMELECLKRRIQQLQLKLKLKTDKCPEKRACMDYEVELKCSKNNEICVLQKQHFKLQCQINELIKCCKYAKVHIEGMRIRMCERVRDIEQLQKMVALLNTWRTTLDHEFGVCIERFEYLKHVKAEWKDVELKMEAQYKCFKQTEQAYLPRKCYVQERTYFMKELADLKMLFKQLYTLQAERFKKLEKRLNKLSHGAHEAEQQKSM